MSRKTNRLKSRLKMGQEKATRSKKRLADWEQRLRQEADALVAARKDLNRSVALRMYVQREFERPYGEAWGLNIVIHPQEYRLMFHHAGGDRMRNASYFAEMKGREAGQKITSVIEKCIAGELVEFEKAG